MQVHEAVETLKSLSGNIWVRDKALLADRISAVLPNIIQTLIDQSVELKTLRNERDMLAMKLNIAHDTIDRMQANDIEDLRDKPYYAWVEALNRLSIVLESLK
jgi:hypothetical protein